MKKIVENIGLAAWELSLLPTRVGLEMEANKILREKKKAEKAAQKTIDKDVKIMVDEPVEDDIVKEAEETQENPNQDGGSEKNPENWIDEVNKQWEDE